MVFRLFFGATKRSGRTFKSVCLLLASPYNLLVAHLLPLAVILTRMETLAAMSPSNVASRTQVRTSDQCLASVPKHEPDASAIFRNKNKCPRQGQQGHTTSRQSEQSRVASSSFKTAPFVDVSRHGEHPRHGQRQYRPAPGQAQVSTFNFS